MSIEEYAKLSDEMLGEADRVYRSKGKGIEWVKGSVPVLTGIALFKKRVEEERKKVSGPIREQLKEVEGPYRKLLEPFDIIDGVLRERVINEYGGKEKVKVEGVGELVFRDVWAFEVECWEIVPDEFLVLDEKKVREAVKDGVRRIPGIRIFQKRQLSVRKGE